MDEKLSVKCFQSESIALRTLSQPVRLRIIDFLQDGEKSVGQIHEMLKISQPVTSLHLRYMYSMVIVDDKQSGTTYNYFRA